MNTSMCRKTALVGWAWAVAVVLGWLAPSAQASPLPFQASGTFTTPNGVLELTGEPIPGFEGMIEIGSLHMEGHPVILGDTTFDVKFTFQGLPSIDVTGTIPWIGYNPDMPVQDVVVITAATADQVGLYPDLFQRLIEHPDWMHTTSFRGDRPDMSIGLSVHAEDPNQIRPVPEPSAILVVAAAFAGLGWKARRASRRVAA